jgi:hypothetical protein
MEQAAHEAGLRDLVVLAAKFGSAFPLAEEYIMSFRGSLHGAVSLTKRVRLLKELSGLWERCEFGYEGKRYRTDKSRIVEAFKAVCDAEKHGFKNHNYLKKILIDRAERISAEGMTAREEEEREERRREQGAGSGERGAGSRERGEKILTAREFADRHKIDSLVGQIGSKAQGTPNVEHSTSDI